MVGHVEHRGGDEVVEHRGEDGVQVFWGGSFRSGRAVNIYVCVCFFLFNVYTH